MPGCRALLPGVTRVIREQPRPLAVNLSANEICQLTAREGNGPLLDLIWRTCSATFGGDPGGPVGAGRAPDDRRGPPLEQGVRRGRARRAERDTGPAQEHVLFVRPAGIVPGGRFRRPRKDVVRRGRRVRSSTACGTAHLDDPSGTLDPARALRIQQACPLAFFDLHLQNRGGHLLDGPSRAFPEVTFLP